MDEAIASKLKLSQLRAFVAVAEHRNFSTAALELGVTQSTVSHAIATLEDALGVVLLVRGRHGALLTSTGEQILPEAQQILRLLEEIQKKASLDRGLQSGVVRVASVRSIATHLLPEVMMQFRQAFPRVSVAISEFDHFTGVELALRDGQADLGLTLLPTPPEFQSWKLLRDEFVALLPPQTLEPETPLNWDDLTRLPLIMTPASPPYEHARAVIDHVMQFGYKLHIAYEMKEDSTVIGMVKRGLGVTVMARLAAEPIPAEIQVRRLPVPLERTIGVAILANALLPKAVFMFIDVLKAVCAAAEQPT
ncbi:MAG: LysR family transcriptional regulator [Synechococcales cyanobacterium M58_A2018_015]|nr:LysR family transcriptional regulator [Synechococcales cyanobacterium M58_A2018_015]